MSGKPPRAEADIAGLIAELAGRVESLSDEKVTEILTVIEAAGGHEALQPALAVLRPRLAQLRPARALTLRRIFVNPFEDLLHSGPNRPPGAIERDLIVPVWQRVEAAFEAVELRQLVAMRSKVQGDAVAYVAVGRRLWSRGERVLAALLASDAPLPDALAARPGVRDQLARMHAVLEIATHVEELKRLLPARPIATLAADACNFLRQRLETVAGYGPDKVPLLLDLIAARMRTPGELMRAVALEDLGLEPALRGEVVARMGEQMVSRLERATTRLDHRDVDGNAAGGTADDPLPTVTRIADDVGRMVDDIVAARAATGEMRNAGVSAKLDAVTGRLRAVVMETIVDGAERTIADALAARGPVADGVDGLAMAEDRAIGLRKAQRYAGALGAGEPVAGAIEAAGRAIERGAAVPVPRDGDGQDRDNAVERLMHSVRVLELIAGPGRADQLRRRGLDEIAIRFR